MGRMIQIRNVPEDVHRALKVRAAKEGASLSSYLLREIERLARRPTFEEWLDTIRSDEAVKPSESSSRAVRAERDSR